MAWGMDISAKYVFNHFDAIYAARDWANNIQVR